VTPETSGPEFDASVSERATQFRGPVLQGQHVHLRAVLPEDLAYLRLMETSSELAPRWRLRGRTPSPQDWAHGTSAGVLAQFMVIANRDRTRVGLVTAFRANFQDGHARLAALAFNAKRPGPLMPVAIGLFIEYVFRCWNFRKLYMDVAEYNLPQMASGLDRIFAVEGRLREHYYLDGEYWDKLILSISREGWARHPKRFLRVEGAD
jgi:RimJ/RimL family protein N-acetyltransferase